MNEINLKTDHLFNIYDYFAQLLLFSHKDTQLHSIVVIGSLTLLVKNMRFRAIKITVILITIVQPASQKVSLWCFFQNQRELQSAKSIYPYLKSFLS